MAASEASDTERRYFDSVIAETGGFNPFTDAGWDVLKTRYRELVPGRTAAKVLDVGCGTGESRRIYDGSFAEYTGLDVSPVAVDAARRRFPDDRWLVADARELPFPDGTFDVVAFSSVLHHLPDFLPAVREGFRVLTPGGAAFAYDPNVFHPGMALFRHPRSPLYLRAGVSPNERPLRPSVLRSAFEAAGFADVRQQCQSGIAYRYVAPRVFNAVLSAMNAADRLWQRIGLGRRFGAFVFTCGTRP